MFTPEHMDYLNEVVEKVNQLADEDPDTRVADLIYNGFSLVDPADYGAADVDLDDEPTAEEWEYVKLRIR